MTEEQTKKEIVGKEKPTQEVIKSATFAEVFSNIEGYDIFLMSVGVICSMITGITTPIFNFLLGDMINALNKDPNSFEDEVNRLCIEFVIVACFNVIAGFLQIYCWSATGERQTQKFRERYVNAILAQEIGWFDNCGANELSTRVAELMEKINDGVGRKFGDLIQYLTTVIGAFVVAFYLTWELTVIMLCGIPFIALSAMFFIKSVTSAQQGSLEQYGLAGGLATETINSMRTVTALNMQPAVISQYRKYLFEAMRIGIQKGLNVGIGNGALLATIFFTYALGFWYGAKLVADDVENNCTHNCISGGSVIAAFFCIIMGSFSLGQLAPPVIAFVSAKAAVFNVYEIITRKPSIDGLSNEGLKPEVTVTGDIILQALQFAYPTRPDIQVCKNYNLHIHAGETVALVGASGSGKSTIINLLLRFYDPQEGCITLDGYNIKELNIKWLRSHIGYVGQEPILFAGTIGDNIAYGLNGDDANEQLLLSSGRQEEASNNKREELMAKVIAAAKLANAHDFISKLPQGYDTDVGSNGVAMSGGQKQRIAIARALIKKPAVLLLDEATSALDATSEKIVQQSIDALARNKAQTTIIIAHRLSTIRNADKIVVVNSGEVVETGKHDELIAKNGKYADLVRLQMSEPGNDEEDDIVEGKAAKEIEEEEEVAMVKEIQAKDNMEPLNAVVLANDDPPSHHLASIRSEVGNVESVKQEELAKAEKNLAVKKIREIIFRYPELIAIGCTGAIFYGGIFPAWGLILAKSEAMFFSTDPVQIREKASLYCCLFIMFGVIHFFAAIGNYYGNVSLGEKIASTIRSQLFEAIMRRSIAFFDHEENSAGGLTTQLAEDSMKIHKAFGEVIAKQLEAIFTLIIGLILAFIASWKIALVTLSVFPLMIVASAISGRAHSGQQYDNETEDADVKKAEQVKLQTKGGKKTEGKPEEKKPSNSTMNGGSGSVISTAFTNMRTVSAFSMHHKVSEHYTEKTRKIATQRTERSIVAAIGFGASNSMQYFSYALLFWYGSQLLLHEGLSFENLMIAIMTLMMGAIGLGSALRDMGDQNEAAAIATRVFATIEDSLRSPIDGLSIAGMIPNSNGKGIDATVIDVESLPRAIGRIELKNVVFRYPTRPNVEVCKGYNLTIEAGQTVALVGPSGSGKSTIINLLLRFYDPLSGEVLLDGQNIKDLNVRWLRSQIGYVGQEPKLFGGSVAENIAKGRTSHIQENLLTLSEALQIAQEEYNASHPTTCFCIPVTTANANANQQLVPTIEPAEKDIELGQRISTGSQTIVDEDIQQACIAANAHEFITTFPQGYDTDVGEGSIMVSGGQKQRIAIARALIKKPAVLLLDEATSALDSLSERVVQQSIDALAESKAQTTIIIAHRLTTIRNADKIVVVDAGEIVEVGTHDELLSKAGGLYRQLWDKQSGTIA